MTIGYHHGWNFRLFVVLLSMSFLFAASAFGHFAYMEQGETSLAALHFKEVDNYVDDIRTNGDISGVKLALAKQHRESLNYSLDLADEFRSRKVWAFCSLFLLPGAVVCAYYLTIFIITGERVPMPSVRLPRRRG